jgi:helix-hairpin-helix protein
VITTGYAELTLFPGCRSELPAGWQGTTGQIFRVILANQIMLVLASPTVMSQVLSCASNGGASGGPAILSQRFPINPICRYRLRIDYVNPRSRPDPTWEVTWLDGSGAPIGKLSGTLISARQRVVGGLRKFDTGSAATQEFGASVAEANLVPPVAASTAELAITHAGASRSPLGLLRISVTASDAALIAGEFRQWEAQGAVLAPTGWMVSGGSVQSLATGLPGVSLAGDGADDTVLSQTISVVGGDTYQLVVTLNTPAPLVAPPPSTAQRARVEIQWSGAPGPSAALLPLDNPGFVTCAWSGDAPSGCTSAQVKIVEPRGAASSVRIDAISLTRADPVEVPLIFLAETPGELALLDLRVGYDLPETPSQTQGAAISGSSPVVKSALGARPLPPPLVKVPVESPVAAMSDVPVAMQLTDISGIGPVRAQRLRAVGIDSVAKLAQASPALVAKSLPIVSIEQATAMVDRASELVHSAADVPSPTSSK